jgi:hypothetical protein
MVTLPPFLCKTFTYYSAPVYPDAPGLTPGGHIVAINGRAYSKERLRDVIKASGSATVPIAIIVRNGEFFTTVSVDYRGGERYPHLERVTGKPDWMETLTKPLVPPPTAAPKKK